MADGGERRRRRQGAGFTLASFRSPLTAIAATLALLIQIVALPYHQARSAPIVAAAVTDVAAVAAELRTTFGDAAALCVQSDDKGAPSAPGGDCDDHCPLCRLASDGAALLVPEAPTLSAPLVAVLGAVAPAPDADPLPFRPAQRNRARAPPFAL